MIQWPDSLVRDIALRRCVFVLGAGVSMNSSNAAGLKPKTWHQFLTDAIVQVKSTTMKTSILKLIKNVDYLTACEILKRTLGRSDFVDLVQNEFSAPGFIASDVHKTIFKLDARIIITPNFDNIYDRYASQESNGTILVKKYYESDIAEFVRLNKRIIIKNHGSVESPNDLIFTRKDYAEARTKYQPFYAILDSLSITNTFLFLGCGTNDPDIRILLEDNKFRFQYSREHYFTLSKNSNPTGVNEVLEETMNIKILEYDKKDDHKEFKESLEDLRIKVDLKRDEIAKTQNW
jgi:hypothetical protein